MCECELKAKSQQREEKNKHLSPFKNWMATGHFCSCIDFGVRCASNKDKKKRNVHMFDMIGSSVVLVIYKYYTCSIFVNNLLPSIFSLRATTKIDASLLLLPHRTCEIYAVD